MVIIIGKTASGKDKTVSELITKHGFKKCITFTTRPMRLGEQQDVTYHFIDKSQFKRLVEQDFFAEWKTYDTVEGTWYYGTALKDLEKADDKTVIILTPDGYRDIIKKLSTKPKAIYLYANNSTIKERLISRGDDPSEAQRRLEHDNTDFKGIENEVDKIFYNNKGSNIDDVVNNILSWLEREGKNE